jgi:hypothetical protein
MSKTARYIQKKACICTSPRINYSHPIHLCDWCGGELDMTEPVKPVLKETPKERYSAEYIGQSPSYRITDNMYDSRIATCYDKESAELVVDALNWRDWMQAMKPTYKLGK